MYLELVALCEKVPNSRNSELDTIANQPPDKNERKQLEAYIRALSVGMSFIDEELAMTEFVEMKSQMAIVMLAEELNYARASERLNITQLELNRQITELENHLELHVFRMRGEDVEVTEAGQLFVNASRTLLATRSGQAAKDKSQD